jgi:hypothetical protein
MTRLMHFSFKITKPRNDEHLCFDTLDWSEWYPIYVNLNRAELQNDKLEDEIRFC